MPVLNSWILLAKWKFIQKSQSNEHMKRWCHKGLVKREYQKNKKEAKKDNADIWWADETALLEN